MNKRQMISDTKQFMADLKKDLDKEIARLIDSGAIDFEFEDARSFGKAKTICKVALQNVADKVTLFNNEAEEDYENLRCF